MKAEHIIEALKLQPHPEGGYFKETYRSEQELVTEQGEKRNVSTAIFYLLTGTDRSHLHRIKSDELWFFHQGSPLDVVYIKGNELVTVTLGNDLLNGESAQLLIPAGTWFGARLKHGAGFALVSCTVAPGFDFADFELAERGDMVAKYPHIKEEIHLLTR